MLRPSLPYDTYALMGHSLVNCICSSGSTLSTSLWHAGVIRVLSCIAATEQQRAALRAAGANAVLSRLVYDSKDHAVQVKAACP